MTSNLINKYTHIYIKLNIIYLLTFEINCFEFYDCSSIDQARSTSHEPSNNILKNKSKTTKINLNIYHIYLDQNSIDNI